MARSIDMNADMGEYADEAQRGVEAALMPLISSCSIACGGHAGDATTMRETVRRAIEHGVSIGAHPAYPDREGFGRRSLSFDPDELQHSLRTQISALKTILQEEGGVLRHVKPHGALYNDASKDERLAEIVASAVEEAILVGAPGSRLEKAARESGIAFAPEGFVDRLYLTSGALTPRSEAGAIITSIDARAAQALAIAEGEPFNGMDGALRITVKTLCIHSDSPGAVETAQCVRQNLIDNGFTIRAF